jgi:hypothetical protein
MVCRMGNISDILFSSPCLPEQRTGKGAVVNIIPLSLRI